MHSKVSMLVLVLGSVLFLAQPGHTHDVDEDFFKYYATCKVMEDCFGKDIMKTWHQKVEEVVTECYEKHIEHEGDTKPAKETKLPVNKDPKRKFFHAAQVRFIKEEMVDKIEFLNCSFNKMNITTNAEGLIETKNIVDYYTGLSINETLKEDIKSGIEKCSRKSSCDEAISYDLVDIAFQRKARFCKCEKRVRMKACIKQDLRTYQDQFEFEGLDGVLDDVPDAADKMLAIVAAKAKLLQSFVF